LKGCWPLGDDNTRYLSPRDEARARQDMEGEISGIGAEVEMRDDRIVIVSPIDDSPAAEAGLQPGDIILEANGVDLRGMDLIEGVDYVRGPEGTAVTLLIERNGEQFEVEIIRARIRIDSVNGEMLEEISPTCASIALASGPTRVGNDTDRTCWSQDPIGLIVDVRRNPGGALDAALDVADQFLPGGTILIERFGDGRERIFEATSNGLATDIPLVVLIDEGSASASEVLAGAIRDQGRGILIGETTFGKGTVQSWQPLSNGGGVRITIARWLTPNDTWIDQTGLEPDITVSLPEVEAFEEFVDTQLETAVDYLRQNGHLSLPIPLEEGLEIARQICTALVEAHAAGIIHRDLKPGNVLLTLNKTAKLMDFGLAHLSTATQLTAEGAFLGTVAYIAPELIQGQPATIQSDLYAFGVLLYELVAGRQPFEAEHLAAVLSQHLHAPVVPPSTYQDEVPPVLDRLVLRLLNKQPGNRPASAGDVLQALENLTAPELVPQPDLPLLDRIARGRLVAREQETAVANSLWQQAMNGEGQTLLISGEPGIGKTRLVQELKVQAEINRARAWWAECYAEGSAPYAPIVQILTQLWQDGALTAVNLPEYAANGLLTIAPALQPLFPDLSPTRLQDPQAEQQRLWDSVLTLLTLLAEQTPLLLVVDDAHWADSGSLNLLRYLARRGRNLPLLLVLTYREVELNEARALNGFVFDLQRERLATRLKLNRLTLQQTHDLLASLFAEEITPEFLQGIYRETEGNPFFVEEVCKALIESGQLSRQDGRWQRLPDMADMRIPQSVRLAIETRVTKLPETVQEVLRLAAVFGRKFEFDLLRQTTELDEDSLIAALEQAERAQLIGEVSAEGGGRFSFAHALIPTTLVEGLSGLRRRRLHRRVAAVIEERNPHDYEALAHHYAAAADEEQAILYYGRAGERALAVYANEDAERHYQAALDIDPEPRARAACLAGLAEAVARQSRPAAAIALFEEAIQLYQSLPDSDQVARLYARLARVVMGYEGRPAGLAICRRGLAAVAGQPETPGLAALLAETARACALNGLLEEAGPLFDKALALAERFSLVAVQAELLASTFVTSALSPTERVTALQKAIDLAEGAGLLETAVRAYTNLAFHYSLMDDTESCCRYLWSALELARRLGSAALELRLMSLLINALCSLGRIDEAEGLTSQIRALLDGHPDLGEAVTAPARLDDSLIRSFPR
jgi:C-terminal peptidase prc